MRNTLNMKIIIFGGDGFCGWPTVLYLSNKGHDIVIVDNLSRRAIGDLLMADSLTPISRIETRLKCWREKTGRKIRFKQINIAKEYAQILLLIQNERPDAVKFGH